MIALTVSPESYPGRARPGFIEGITDTMSIRPFDGYPGRARPGFIEGPTPRSP